MSMWFFRFFRKKRECTESIEQNGEKIGRIKFKVMIEPHLDKDFFKNALKLIPNIFEFEIVEWDESKLFQYNSGGWKNFWMPKEDKYVVVFDGIKWGTKYGGGTIYERCGIAYYGEELLPTALRIWHELSHTQKLPADDMMNDSGFDKWLPENMKQCFRKAGEHDLHWQILFYTYLTEKLVR